MKTYTPYIHINLYRPIGIQPGLVLSVLHEDPLRDINSLGSNEIVIFLSNNNLPPETESILHPCFVHVFSLIGRYEY